VSDIEPVPDEGPADFSPETYRREGLIERLGAEQSDHDGSHGPDSGLEESIHWQAVDTARAFD